LNDFCSVADNAREVRRVSSSFGLKTGRQFSGSPIEITKFNLMYTFPAHLKDGIDRVSLLPIFPGL
jgi:hypothetical protein